MTTTAGSDTAPSGAPAREIIGRREWVDGPRRITVDLDAALRMLVVLEGKGSIDGAHALCRLVDELRDEVGHDKLITALVDMRRTDGAPLRSQTIIGRWLLSRKKQIDRVAVFGGGRIEMGIARMVMLIAGMSAKAHFGAEIGPATSFLGWPAGLHR